MSKFDKENTEKKTALTKDRGVTICGNEMSFF